MFGKRSREVSRKAEDAEEAAEHAIKLDPGDVRGPSPNPMTNLVLADIALRGASQLALEGIERLVLGRKFAPGLARKVLKGRSMGQTLIGTALARAATRSVPGAILVGGAMLAKTLYDRAQDRREANAEGERDLAKEARKGRRRGA